ncbi:hydroxyacid dehydrogenase [Planococcus halotolerans]|uniref:hydroxyacid dehydrogenase n=1 Tax=Planococcus halotolerans TaxID=2233542 RepID=UPI001092941E|nr:hydroxyacid dehydrogenase [Planococcus halotolerans]QHJ70110.1 hypothetical protein DNR44_005630 [Planococcus halotolerans]
MQLKVLVPQPIAQEGIDFLEQAGVQVIIPPGHDEKTLLNYVQDADAILMRTGELSRKVIEKAEKLKIISKHGVGVDNIDIEAATEQGVLVTNAPYANSNAVAEHVLTLILAGARQLLQVDKALRSGDFEIRNRLFGMELKGKTLGIIGFGNIGQLVAEKCHYGLGMEILVYDPYFKERNAALYVEVSSSLEEVLTVADVITLHVPYLPATHHLIDEKSFGLMKKSALFINAARGGIVDEAALEEAVRNEQIRGACIDCFQKEPPQENFSLWELENVIVTPHIAAHTEEAMIEMALAPAKDIIAVLKGDTALYPVNEKELRAKR